MTFGWLFRYRLCNCFRHIIFFDTSSLHHLCFLFMFLLQSHLLLRRVYYRFHLQTQLFTRWFSSHFLFTLLSGWMYIYFYLIFHLTQFFFYTFPDFLAWSTIYIIFTYIFLAQSHVLTGQSRYARLRFFFI